MKETIQEAKKSLESKILSSGYVTSIGTRQRGEVNYIRVGVLDEKNVADLQSMLTEGKWQGFDVEIEVRPPSIPHSTIKKSPMSVENIADLIMGAFRVKNSKPNHSMDQRWFNNELTKKLDPKEQMLVAPAIALLENDGMITTANQHGAMTGYFLILTEKGYESIYPIDAAAVIEIISQTIMAKFAADHCKPNQIITEKWFQLTLSRQLNPRQRDYVNPAIASLVQKGFVTMDNRNGWCLVLTQKGFDELY